jgi:hypothetical protein
MSQFQRMRLSFLVPACLLLAGWFSLSGWGHGQILNVDQEIEVGGPTSIISPSPHGSDVLATSLASIIHDAEVCCGRDSALEDSVAKADPKSLQDVAAKLKWQTITRGWPTDYGRRRVLSYRKNECQLSGCGNDRPASAVNGVELAYLCRPWPGLLLGSEWHRRSACPDGTGGT